MNKSWPLQLKITLAITLILSLFGVYQIASFPRNIDDSRLFKREGIVGHVDCRDGKRDYSPKYIYVSGETFQNFYFRMEGKCVDLIGLI